MTICHLCSIKFNVLDTKEAWRAYPSRKTKFSIKTWVFLSKFHRIPNKYNANFCNYFGVQEQNWKLRVLIFNRYLPFKFRLRNVERCISSKFISRTNLMHFLLPICGKFTGALLAHQIFFMYFCAHIAQILDENSIFRIFKAIFFWVKGKSNLFNKYKYVPKGLRSFEIFLHKKWSKSCFPTHTRAIFFNLKK
jgi:hypothetical protein